eukprot:3939510-Rhodomonas_salina.2
MHAALMCSSTEVGRTAISTIPRSYRASGNTMFGTEMWCAGTSDDRCLVLRLASLIPVLQIACTDICCAGTSATNCLRYKLSGTEVCYAPTVMIDDFREAYWWVRDNTPEDSRYKP